MLMSFGSLLLIRYVKKLVSFLNRLQEIGKTKRELPITSLDYWYYFSCVSICFIIIAIMILFIKYIFDYTRYWVVAILTLTAFFVCIVFTFNEVESLNFIYLLLFYLLSLPFNYTIISIIKKIISKLYLWLYTKKRKLDPAKLTLLWTIIVFILGLLFNIKK